ncbi:hypothetical protein ORV05_32075 [Amycolatopsis cynarae]|uniref:Uncharacterized protein n=1 Tax=Amycolatopsis cynarae TaxID=2995223 RepID=A0ABY7B3J7_9PSEU|nr:hypothetical protein [Amycolatopsis sp. HUAS 11-8]WAL65476.1 hypothetical protein ORV05_32075 [Amycolatopsis sp. HUAS 11-8]
MTHGDDLEGELRRLFSDERLDLRPRGNAAAAVVAGARRVRRRRALTTATSGVLAAILLVGAVLYFGAPSGGGQQQVAAPPPEQSAGEPAYTYPPPPVPIGAPARGPLDEDTTGGPEQVPPASPVTRPATSAPDMTTTAPRMSGVPLSAITVLGPDGYGALRLGMSFDQAKATGQLTAADAPSATCTRYTLREGAAAVGSVLISPKAGIVGFDATGARTPESVHVGSTVEQLAAAYPDLVRTPDGFAAPAGRGATYQFTIDDHDQVSALRLAASTGC